MRKALLWAIALLISVPTMAQRKSKDQAFVDANISGLSFRNVGPATTSGRIADLAVNPNNPAEYYLAIASGGVWKTTNNGTTFTPIFDAQGSYSTGCVTIDPNNSNVIWVGTGENNNQRSVAYGDGVYKSEDGGKTWKNMGLKTSEHIGMIAVDPTNSNKIWVAAYGPLWSKGGERGLYVSTDGGENWSLSLGISEHTGINEVHLDPRDPKVIYATAHQRRRHVYTYLSGGPESAIYKSTDGGAHWSKLGGGLPSGDLGRIGMDISPVNPDVLYATIEGHGMYRSTDRGASWVKRGGHQTSGNYYVELIAHPTELNTVYSMDTYGQVSTDGGKTFNRIPKRKKHVDNHCLWIDPNNTQHMLIGTDGGLYETWDGMANWGWKANIPTIQFYRVAVDNVWPFYNIFGGTQDNNSLGGPSQTINTRGIINEDWYVTNGGDGFESAIDPEDPNTVYAQAQYGWLVRFNKQTGEKTPIQPQPGYGEAAYRWNWDAPLIISPHNSQTLYFAANKVFKSTDRGDTWTTISGDLSRQLDRNTLPIMDRYWGPDAVALHRSTSIYGNIVALRESAHEEGVLWAGTDDGLIWKTTDGGANWTSIKSISGLPKLQVGSLSLPLIYVNDVVPSVHEEKTVFAVYNNHKNGDFAPYLYMSKDGGKSWKNINGDLPERGSTYAFIEDPKNKDLWFVGTEFGVFFTLDGGEHWKALKSGLPTIAVRDIAIQERENDLVLGTFGRGFYVLDDYSPLRELTEENTQAPHMFNITPGLLYNKAYIGGTDYKGAQYYTAKNAPVGVTFSYYLPNAAAKVKDARPEANEEMPHYPSLDQLRAEDREESAYLLFIIKDSNGKEVSRFTRGDGTGLQRTTWDGKVTSSYYISTSGAPKTGNYGAYFVAPGDYTVTVMRSTNGLVEPLIGEKKFTVKHLYNPEGIDAEFNDMVNEISTSSMSIESRFKKLEERHAELSAGFRNIPNANLAHLNSMRSIANDLADVKVQLEGDNTRKSREFEAVDGLYGRLGLLRWAAWNHRGAPTGTMQEQADVCQKIIQELDAALRKIEAELHELEQKARNSGVPVFN